MSIPPIVWALAGFVAGFVTASLLWIHWQSALLRVLRAVLQCDTGDGVTTLHLHHETGESIGGVHVAVDALERRGLVRTTRLPGGPERGGYPQRIVYAANPQGDE